MRSEQFQHQPYALHHSPATEPPHRLEPEALLSQDERVAAELAAALPSTPRLAADNQDVVSMSRPEDDARGRSREPGEPTPEKPALKKLTRSTSEVARRNA